MTERGEGSVIRLCECGCGEVTSVAKTTSRRHGRIKGEQSRFVHGHNTRVQRGPASSQWRGGRYLSFHGYVDIYQPEHPRARNGHMLEHIVLAERALGRQMVRPEQVHHVDENRANNAPGNLVLCPDTAYHQLLHQRARALKACGNANWRKCELCKNFSDPAELAPGGHAHRACANAYSREWKRRKRRAALS